MSIIELYSDEELGFHGGSKNPMLICSICDTCSDITGKPSVRTLAHGDECFVPAMLVALDVLSGGAFACANLGHEAQAIEMLKAANKLLTALTPEGKDGRVDELAPTWEGDAVR